MSSPRSSGWRATDWIIDAKISGREIVSELKGTNVPERAGRAQDQESEDAFEKLRRDGYM